MALIHPRHSIEPHVFFGKMFIDPNLKTEPPFDPASLFENGEQGLFYDPNTLEGVGQTVATIPDLSSNNNHASNTNSAQQALLSANTSTSYKYLSFDGTDDGYTTLEIDLTHTDSVTVIAAFDKLRSTGLGTLVEFSSTSVTNNGVFSMGAPFIANNDTVGFRSRGTSHANNLSSVLTAPAGVVATACGVISQDLNNLRVNGILYSNTLDQGTGNFGKYPIFIGRRNLFTNAFLGNLYALLIIDRLLTDAEIQKVEEEFAKRIGVSL